MRFLRVFYLSLATAVCSLGTLTPQAGKAQSDFRLMTFGSGGIGGNYYGLGREICNRVNLLNESKLRCSPEITPGSLYNLFAMMRGELDFALVQSDIQRHAVEGTGPFAEQGPMEGLRSVMSLYKEAITLVTRTDSEVRSLTDLEGRIIDIGHPTTARRATIDDILSKLALGDDYFAELRYLTGSGVSNEVCDGTIDATVLIFGHPNETLRSALENCDLRLIGADGRLVRRALAGSKDYTAFRIPANTYAENPRAVDTYAVSATLVTRADVPDEWVELMARTILDEYSTLQHSVSVLPPLSIENAQTDGLTAPMHPAALSVFSRSPADN